MKKFLSFALSLLLVLALLAGCAKPAEPVPSSGNEKVRVALILEGAISDMSWNATAYQGLQKIEAMGAETRYVESVPVSEVADAIRTFAEEKYDVIYLATSSYADAGLAASKEYPDIQFFIINARIAEGNIISCAIQDAEQGFLMGALAALLTESGTVGFIGGQEIQPIINGGKGFEQGAKYVNPNITILANNTGDFNDVAGAKNLAKTMVGRGADVLAPMANQASLGVMEAAEEEGIKAVGSGANQETVAPNAAVVAIMKDTSIAYEASFKSYLDKAVPKEIFRMGAAQGVVHVGKYYIDVPQDVKDQLQAICDKLAKGEITIDLS